jgi:hypothetical protein
VRDREQGKRRWRLGALALVVALAVVAAPAAAKAPAIYPHMCATSAEHPAPGQRNAWTACGSVATDHRHSAGLSGDDLWIVGGGVVVLALTIAAGMLVATRRRDDRQRRPAALGAAGRCKAMRAMTIPAVACGLVAGFFGVGLLGAAGPGHAHDVAGTAYIGTYADGRVEFEVSADGKNVTRFKVTKNSGEPCAESSFLPGHGLSIKNHAFGGFFSPLLSISGSFNGNETASGTFVLRGDYGGPPVGCPLGSVTWSAASDATPPTLLLGDSANESSTRGSVAVEADCPQEACAATAKGTVAVRGAARRFKLRRANAQIPTGGKAELSLEISRKTRRAINQALSEGRKVTANVTVTAHDWAGNATSRTRTIQLKR